MRNLKKIVLSLYLINSFLCQIQAHDKQSDFLFSNRASWEKACSQLPMNIDVSTKNQFQSGFAQHADTQQDKKLAFKELDTALDRVMNLCCTKLDDTTAWTDAQSCDLSSNKFMPYAEKLKVNPGQKVVFHGDFHGDIHSFHAELKQLEQQKILKQGSFELADKNVHLAFLGDYVDRGNYGAEVIYTLLRLKLANPDNVLIVRGNHEDQQISDRYGFKDELKAKFGSDEEKYKKIYRFYNLLPVVAYVGHGNDYLQCCHGGLEYGYKPQNLLESNRKYDAIGQLKRGKFKDFLDQHKNHHNACCCANQEHNNEPWQDNRQAFRDYIPVAPIDNNGSVGFMWADFLKFGPSCFKKGRGLGANQDLTKAVLDFQNDGSQAKVRGVVRAHQHAGIAQQDEPSNLMYELIKSNGLYCMWKALETAKERSLKDGLVWTFNTAPDSPGNKNLKYGFDAYAILTVAKKYEDWKLSVHNSIIIDRSDYSKPCDFGKN